MKIDMKKINAGGWNSVEHFVHDGIRDKVLPNGVSIKRNLQEYTFKIEPYLFEEKKYLAPSKSENE